MSVISVQNLSIAFNNKVVVENVSFDILPEDTFALVGESGSGKSITAMSILKLLPYPTASHPAGAIHFEGDDLIQFNDAAMRKIRGDRIGMIFQEPMTALNPLQTIEKQISEVLRIHRGMSITEARIETISLLEKVQISNAETRLGNYPHELSGGQRQRVMIAMALANKPKLLIADEPTTALDVTVQYEILELLEALKQEFKMSILLITHDLGVVRHHANRMAVMQQGKIVEQGATETIFKSPQHAHTRELLESEPSPQPIELEEKARENILTVNQLTVKFPLENPFFRKPRRWLHAVNNATFKLKQGTTLGVIGESGSGKSTLAMAILRLLNCEGDIVFNGQNLAEKKEKDIRPLRRKIQVVFQDPFSSLSPRMTIANIIAEGLQVYSDLNDKERDTRVIEVLQEVGLSADDRHRYPHEFSGGQRQRVAIARALILQPELLILDEPTSALDRAVQVQVMDLLKQLQQKYGLTYIFISHDLRMIRAISHDVLVMRQGEMVEYGPAAKVLTHSETEYTKRLIDSAFL